MLHCWLCTLLIEVVTGSMIDFVMQAGLMKKKKDLLPKSSYIIIGEGKFYLKKCRDPGSNQGPLDLQSNALPTELSRLL